VTVLKSVTSAGPYNTVGQVISYKFVATNTGNVMLTAVGVADTQTAPAGALTTGPNCQSLSSPTGTCSGATTTLVPGQTATFIATYTITLADLNNGSINDSATASGTPPTGSPVTSTPSTATVSLTQTAALTVLKSVTSTGPYNTVSQTIAYSFTVTDTGNVTLTSVGVTDTQTAPAGALTTGPTCQSLSGPIGSCSGSTTTVAPGQSATFTATYTMTQADIDKGSVSDSATASGTPPTGSPVTSTPSTATVTISQNPALSLAKSAGPMTYSAVGTPINYSYKITNAGNTTLSGPFTVSDNKTTATCPATATLAPAAALTCTGTYAITQADMNAGSVTNLATATTGALNSPQASATVTAIQTAALTLSKTASVTSYSAVGTPIVYSFKITNTGNVTLTSVGVTDPHVGLSAISCSTPTLAPSASETCTANYSATQTDLNNGSISNTAQASGTPPNGPAVTSQSSVTIPASYLLTTGVNPAGGGTVTPASGTYYLAGTVVPLTATANSGYSFSSWTGNVASTSANPTSIKMTGPQTVTANFGQPPVITSANHATFTLGKPNTFPVTTTGYPIPSIGEIGPLPNGVTLTDNHNGTATLGGTPTQGGVFPITITANNGVNPPKSSPVTGGQSFTLTVSGPLLQITPPSINFGTVYIHNTQSENVTLKNIGTSTVNISNVALTLGAGTSSTIFKFVNGCSSTLAAGHSCNITINFNGTPAGTPSATLKITGNSPGSPQTVPLSATIINPKGQFDTASLGFATVKVGSSHTKTVTFTNVGTTTLDITSFGISGPNHSDFTETNNCPSTLSPGNDCVITLTFKPSATGNRSATLTAIDNTQVPEQTVALTGKGD
jgi:uncharacterized repeat protein (TIGR01451 family)